MTWHNWLCDGNLQLCERRGLLLKCACQFILVRSLGLDPTLFLMFSRDKSESYFKWTEVEFIFPSLSKLIEGFAMTHMDIDS